MITPNPIMGTGLHAVGGISASACYLPFNETSKWSWGSFWLVQAAFAWLIMPIVIGLITVPHLFTVLSNSPASALIIPFALGAFYGFGGLSFGYAIRHIGFSLTYTISIGISAVIGTITPLIINGTLIEHFRKPGGSIVLSGMIMSMLGVALCGAAGYKKEKDLSKRGDNNGALHFNMKKGLALSIFAGILSAVFGISLVYGQPISDLAAQYGAGHYEGNAKIIVSTAGCFVTNFFWFLILGIRQGTIKELIQTKSIGTSPVFRNYLWSAFGGSLWYFQFFFYGLGHVRMGNFMFASWVIHMSMLVFFSYLVGILMKEWKKVSRKTYATLIIAMFTLVLSFVIMSFGTLKGEEVPAPNSITPGSLPDDYNITWNFQSNNASESMPLVGGDIGCNVWVENGDILVYMQRSGSLDENGEFLKMGRFRLKIYPNPFEGEAIFRQELKLSEGYIEIESIKDDGSKKPEALLKLWVDVYKPVLHFDVESSQNTEVTLAYESWRTEDKELLPIPFGRERFGAFNLEGYPGKVIRAKDHIEQNEDGILFYHRNAKEKLTPEVLIKLQELEEFSNEISDDLKNRTFGGFVFGRGFLPDGRGEGTYQATPFKSWKIKSETPKKKHHLVIATHIGQLENFSDWKENLFKTVETAAVNQEESLRKTIAWWTQFWNRSHIYIHPENPDPSNPVWQMSRNYQLFRYQLGGNVFGEYPSKFNGGNLIFDPVLVNEEKPYEPDWRQWGGAVFTAQNQRLLYWPMLKSGDFDAILPQFELYRKGLPGARARVKKHFGHPGAVYCEYTSVPGIAIGDGWGWKNAYNYRIRGEEIPFGDPRANASMGFGDPVEEGVMANGAIAYHWESQVEHAYMILEYHRFTGADISAYMPFIEQSLIFFDEHYRKRQKIRDGNELDENGKLVIYPSTACESYRGAKNPTDINAGLRACLNQMLQLDEKYLSAERKEYYGEFLGRIPDYAFGEVDGQPVLKPAENWLRESNQELPQFYPLFPFNQFKLGDDEIQVFKNTYRHAPAFRKGKIQSWHQDGIFFARMGMTAEAADYNTRKLQDSQRRFPTFWGPGHDWVPDHNWGGSGMIGLQEMLLQTTGDNIVLFPAWPMDWDVDFKLHAPGNTTVEARLVNGTIEYLKVFPESRRGDLIVMINNDL